MTHHSSMLRCARRAAIVATAVALAGCHSTSTVGSGPAPAAPPARDASAAAARRAPPSYPLTSLDGSRLTVTVVEVAYRPGESSKAHSHPCPVVGYILEGAYRTQVKGEAEHVYTAGDTFYEPANGVHAVSANASTEKPVRFLAYFTCDRQTPLVVPPPDSSRSR